MKKYLTIIISLILLVSCFACAKKAEEVVTPTEEPVQVTAEPVVLATAEPEPTDTPAPTEEPTPTPVSEEDAFKNLILGDGADIDYVMNDIIGAWDNFTVKMEDTGIAINYYIIPKKDAKKIDDMIGMVTLDCDDNNTVREVNFSVFIDDYSKNKEAVDKLYEFMVNEYGAESISGFNADVWKGLVDKGTFNFAEAYAKASSLGENDEDKVSFGDIDFKVANDAITMTFFGKA